MVKDLVKGDQIETRTEQRLTQGITRAKTRNKRKVTFNSELYEEGFSIFGYLGFEKKGKLQVKKLKYRKGKSRVFGRSS